MIDIKLIRENKELVKENIKKKFQDEKLPLVDEIYELDNEYRDTKLKMDTMRAEKNKLSSEIGNLMRDGKREEAEEIKTKVSTMNNEIDTLTSREEELSKIIKEKMMVIPNIVASDVPVGKDDSENVELKRFGEATVPAYEIPYHADILESIDGLDKDASGRTSGNGFYYLMGDAARLSSAMLAYARDFMVQKGFTYCIPPFMIRSDVVTGVMSFAEMDAMMYKIEGYK